MQEIFLSILHQYAEEKAAKNETNETEESTSVQGIKVIFRKLPLYKPLFPICAV